MMTTTKTQMTTHPCGCVNALHEPTGALRRVLTCSRHMREYRAPETLGEAYYTELGLLDHGMLKQTNHVAELTEALGPIPSPKGNDQALEIGCGTSPYAGEIVKAGWTYCGIDASRWACGWMDRIWGVPTINARFEDVDDSYLNYPSGFIYPFGFILAAHSFEHMDDAPGAIKRCAELLTAGGQLWIVTPDDTDKTNPDHQWAFSQYSLWYTVEAAGLTVEHITSRRYIQRENFLYVRASKPTVEAASEPTSALANEGT